MANALNKPRKRLEGAVEPGLKLLPESGVQVQAGEPVAVALPFWLRLEPLSAIARHRWVQLRYSASFFDEPVRPLIRFATADGRTIVQPMNGPILGRGEWIGRVPDRTRSVAISPGRRLGRFSFRIDSIAPVSRGRLLRTGFASDWQFAAWSVRSRLINSREEGWQALKFAGGGTEFRDYAQWHAELSRPLEPDGLDRPRCDWNTTPVFHLIVSLRGAETRALQETLDSLRAQTYARWALHAVLSGEEPDQLISLFRSEMARDRRLHELQSTDRPQSAFPVAAEDRIAVIEPGDRLPEYALAAIAERLAREPDLAIIYSDEDAAGNDGRPAFPVLKPDWSPIFHAAVPYIGRFTFVRWAELAGSGVDLHQLLFTERETLDRLMPTLACSRIGHIRRILCRRHARPPADSSPPRVTPMRRRSAEEAQWPEVSVVIPTRDRADLLAECTRGLKEKTDYPSLRVVIVDNASTDRRALVLLDDLRADPLFTVLDRPEPFNYSKLSNDGARATASPMLVFMNNDIRIVEDHWLKAMVRWAVQPQVGVVGAKLLFPGGRIQHAGVVTGMGGLTGHVYRRSPRDERGYLQQLTATREVSAVTGACIAIARTKFEVIGGFDAENLPVDLNDIDLSLRAAECGWCNVCTPDAVLMHVQSATRGMEWNPFTMYRKERDYFTPRWLEALRDDPYFHPALSLFSQRPMLG